jgi:sugar O-acyltransferase (sialic acid O-acetyltransferase NeuD family)
MPAMPHMDGDWSTALAARRKPNHASSRTCMAKRRIIVLGAGGAAREVAWAIGEIEGFSFAGFAVTDLKKLGPRDSEVLGDAAWLRAHQARFDALAIGIGSPAARLRVAADLERDFGPEMFPAILAGRLDQKSAEIAHGVIFLPGSTGTVNLRLGPHVLVHYGCTIGHETRLGRCSVVNPGANLSGGVEVGSGVLIGTGAQVLQYRSIGDGAIVGAGAVVTRHVAAGATVTGIPARPR